MESRNLTPAGSSVSLSDATPQDPGTAAAGDAETAARGNHVHNPCTASQAGALPASTLGSTDNAVLRANGTGGSTPQASTVIIADDGTITIPAGGWLTRLGTVTAWSGAGNTVAFTPPGDGFLWLKVHFAIVRNDTGTSWRFSTWQQSYNIASGVATALDSGGTGEEEDALIGSYAPFTTLDVASDVPTLTFGTAGQSGLFIVWVDALYSTTALA